MLIKNSLKRQILNYLGVLQNLHIMSLMMHKTINIKHLVYHT
jgi:hypothetical protein